ncbi:TadE/TadG family type IV pilus assembly protein [Rhizobium sp. SL86]|uniref:TadE/TadG family type IV pilus assembly protein n=1 Tax=Rhizobium sp. SL86 TaxID=2995148 RepID=UPI00227566F0|nr:TadE/TadG family type IV pilus assembly protein [Rhizobium sp. SL86]MCY1665135.1 pilus assembly protein [Rhizobium sp. SL86]
MRDTRQPFCCRSKLRRGIFLPLRRLLIDRRGIGGVEFAILAPILIALYITCFELTIGFSVSKRVTRAAGTVADLVTQQSEVNKTYLATMVDVSKAIFVPYNSSAASISLKLTGIQVDSTGTPKVVWSWDQSNAAPYAVGTTVTGVPTEMKTADTFLVRSELSVPHELLMFLPGVVSSETRSITIGRTYFYRQRVGDSVLCKDCS